jgi:hypothetical protein
MNIIAETSADAMPTFSAEYWLAARTQNTNPRTDPAPVERIRKYELR